MLQILRNNKLKAVLIIVLITLLLLIRAFEAKLFYDPFLDYFLNGYLTLPFPEFDGLQLFFGMTFRYFLNTMISLGIINVIFKDKNILKFVSLLYLLFFVILLVAFFTILLFFDEKSNFILFYVRRFLIQPLFLLLFIPALLFQKKQ